MAKYIIDETILGDIAANIKNKINISETVTLSQIISVLENKGINMIGNYLWARQSTQDGEIIGYVISNNYSEYPTDGSQHTDGYYYMEIS